MHADKREEGLNGAIRSNSRNLEKIDISAKVRFVYESRAING